MIRDFIAKRVRRSFIRGPLRGTFFVTLIGSQLLALTNVVMGFACCSIFAVASCHHAAFCGDSNPCWCVWVT